MAIAIGNAAGKVLCREQAVSLGGVARCSLVVPPGVADTSLTIVSERGKLGDSEDSFLFFGFRIDPSRENAFLSAEFTVENADGTPDWQAGYGIAALDTGASARPISRYRNMLFLGRQRTTVFNEAACGVRTVAGHTDPSAEGKEEAVGARRTDTARSFRAPGLCPKITLRETIGLSLHKTNRGFTAALSRNGRTEKLRFPGCDFLTKQDPETILIGFAVAGRLRVHIYDVRFSVTDGRASRTPVRAIHRRTPEYPFRRSLLPSVQKLLRTGRRILYVSPSGNACGMGTLQSPMDLQTALLRVPRGGEIVLADGVYRPDQPYLIPCGRTSGVLVRAEHAGMAVLDGSCLRSPLPVMIANGLDWTLSGLAFRRSRSAGLLLSGSGNRVDLCSAYENGDTGILICAIPRTPARRWPECNLVSRCESFRNSDKACRNADGFGAKLSIGPGNRFFRCSAHHNADDGFDLYAKKSIGRIGAVKLEECAAYLNGNVDDGSLRRDAAGFKLGGEDIPIEHEAIRCIAYGNGGAGFFSNSNPAVRLKDVLAWANGGGDYLMNVRYPECPGGWVLEGLLSDRDETLSCGAEVRRAHGLPESFDPRCAEHGGILLISLIDLVRKDGGNGCQS